MKLRQLLGGGALRRRAHQKRLAVDDARDEIRNRVSFGRLNLYDEGRVSLLGHLGYDKSHLDQLIGFVAAGRLDVAGSISDVMPLDDVVRGVKRLATKDGDPIRLGVSP